MELDINSTRKVKLNNESLLGDCSVNLYMTPPFGQLTLEECEDLFRQRLEALALTETNPNVPSNMFREIKSHVFKTNCILLRKDDKQQHKQDHYSHMLARMFCIHRQDLWNWFKTCERKLLYLRLRDQVSSISGGQFESMLKNFDFDFERVIGTELSELYAENLIGWNSRQRENIDIFKVKFTDALRFIARRSVALKDGYAFLSKNEIITVVCEVFERHLDEELSYARQHMDVGDTKVAQLLENLLLVYNDFKDKMEEEKRKSKKNSNEHKRNPYSIDVDNIEEVVKNHYPPCMRNLHEALVKDSHLKYSGRLHYTAYLSSGGVEVNSAIELFRNHFTKNITNEKFERDYKYNIRHIYGLEGHKNRLSCFSCDKIISETVGTGDNHGCPFSHFDDKHLKAFLQKMGHKEVDIESLFSYRGEKDYKLTCSHHFKFLKGELPTEPIKNPIHYYYESMRLANRPPPADDQDLEEKEGGDEVKSEEKPMEGLDYSEMDDVMKEFL